VTSNDEPIGLSRGVLYAGAGALIVSLWNVSDASTLGVMRRLYQALAAGQSKAEALRCAQTYLLSAAPELHPAYWGAFQLIGNPDPLSARAPGCAAVPEKELYYVDFRSTA
jgi:CHAT domain-containing protein